MVLRKAYTEKTYENKELLLSTNRLRSRGSDTAGADLICLINLLNKLKS